MDSLHRQDEAGEHMSKLDHKGSGFPLTAVKKTRNSMECLMDEAIDITSFELSVNFYRHSKKSRSHYFLL